MADNVAITAGAGTNIATDDIGGVHYQIMKNAYGAADSVTQVDATNPLPAVLPDATASGSITTQNLVPAGAATANSAVEITMNGRGGLVIQVTGTYTGALTVQGTLDGTTWVSILSTIIYKMNNAAISSTVPSAGTGIYLIQAPGHLKLRVSGLAAMTGTAVVTLRGTASTIPIPQAIPIGANTIGNVGATLLAGSNAIGGVYVAPITSGGYNTTHHAISAAGTNATSVKAFLASVGTIVVSNSNAAIRYFKLYNKASAPTVGTDTPVLTLMLKPGEATVVQFESGLALTTGLAYAITTGMTVADTGAVSASEHSVFINYL